MADQGFANGGSKVEHHRREDRGAEGVGVGKRYPLLHGEGLGNAPSPEFFYFRTQNGDF